MKHERPSLLWATALALLLCTAAHAQRAKYWVGGSGDWHDARHWSATAGGSGGAGVPDAGHDAIIIAEAGMTLRIDGDAACHTLRVNATHGAIIMDGLAQAEMEVGGSFHLSGAVDWRFRGEVRLNSDEDEETLDANGVLVTSDVVLDGEASWTLRSALQLSDDASLTLAEGSLRLYDGMLKAGAFNTSGRAPKHLEAGSAIVLVQALGLRGSHFTHDASASVLMAGGVPMNWDGTPRYADDFARGITNCGTGVGQTPFQVNAFVTTNYNGFGVSCNGACDGAVNVTITGGSGNFSIQWQGGPGGNGTSLPWTDLCAGNKLVIVTDLGQNVGCFANALITPPPPLGVLFFGLNPPTCADACNGTAITFPGGGAGSGYVYDWNNGVEASSNPSQLCAGVNTLELTDANNCVFDTSFTIDLQQLVATLQFVDASCAGDCDGSAQVSVTGGTPDYDYDWEPGAPAGDGTNAVSGLCAGNYTVLVTDANGCDTTIVFTVIAPPPIVPNPTSTPASCSGTCDGTATVLPVGAAGPFDYEWEPGSPAGDNTNAVTGLCAGDYTVLITDQATGCDTLITITIDAPPALDVQISTTPVTCSGDCDGTATISINGGTPGFTIVWAPGAIGGQGTTNATGLCAGNYSVTVTDDIGCDTMLQFIILGPQPIIANGNSTNVTCFGACNGTASVAPSGGTVGVGGYGYDWTPDPIVGEGTPNAAVLCAGIWCVTITDSLGCDTTVCFNITEPSQLTLAPSQTSPSCGNDCDGTATADVNGGNPPYTYDWSGNPTGEGTPTASDLCAGVYTLTVTDSAGCFLLQTYFIDPPLPIDVSVATTNATCPDFCNGTASATVTGGAGGYTYDWQPAPGGGQNSSNATGLCAQDYTLTVIDSLGCDTTITFTITAPLPIDAQATVTQTTCSNSCDGSIVLNTSGGTGTFTYTWTPPPPNAQGTPQALNLCAGTWSVLISDGVCDTTLVFQLDAPLPIDAALTTTPASCNGACDGSATSNTTGGTPDYTYVWSPPPGAGQGTANATQMCPGNYTLTITDDAGCDTVVAFTIDEPQPIIPDVTTTLASCGGSCDGTATTSFSGGTGDVDIFWSPTPGSGQGTTTAGGLCPGIWTVTFTDSLGCDTSLQFTINTPSGIVAVPTITDATCADACDGTITLDVSGGVPGYTYTWTPVPPIGGGTNVGGLCPGQWVVQIGDQAGCDTVLVMDVGAPASIIPNGVFTNETCNGPCDGTASVNPTGGVGGFVYSWSPPAPIGDGTANVAGLCAGNWSVTITDASGCDTTWSFTVLGEQPIDPALVALNATCAFTCNGTATVDPTGGSGNYTYTWSPTPDIGQGTDSVSALCLGLWSVTVADDNGCDTTVSFIITKPSPITTSLAFGAANCNGPCTADAAAFPSGSNGGFTYFWQPDPGFDQGSFYVDSLCAGVTYTLTVTDSLGCDTTETFTIPAFTPIAANLSSTGVTCVTDCDGTATVGPTGGAQPYTYEWSPDPIIGDSTNSVTGLCAGVYDLMITDADGCDTTISVLITAPAPILVQPSVSPITCNGDCNGAIDLNAQGGTGTLTFTWSPQPPVGQGTDAVAQLCAGTWTVTVADANGCDTTMSFTIADPAVLNVQPEVVQSQCQACVGVITLHATGGGGGYFFAWGPPINQTTTDSVQSGLCAGLYTVIIGDALGCVTQIAVPVSDSNGEALSTTDDDVTCPTDCDGLVTVSFNCAAPSCSINWFDALGTNLNATNDSLGNLCAGTYLVQVVNGDGCTTIDSAQVFAPPPIDIQIASTPASCAGICDGSAGIGISGGVAPYTILWDPAPAIGQGTTNALGLCAGTYDVTVTDDNGCSVTVSVLILGPQPIDADATVQDVTCAGSCDGSITLNTSGGTGTYTYLWNPLPPGGGGASATNLCPGAWNVIIVDANGCDTTLSFVIAEPLPISLSPSATPSHCALCDGTADVQVSGGTGNVIVTWTDQNGGFAGSGASLTDLCAGIYTATAQDANGCVAQVVVVVTDASGETLAITNGQTTCANNCDGSVSVSFNCTDGPCEIEWYDATGQLLAQNQFTLTDLCIGDYYVAVMNDAGCTVIDTATVSPSQTIVPNLSTSPVTCAGGCDGTATVGPVGGLAPYTFDWIPDPTGGDSTATVTGLCAGVYSVYIADSTGCDTIVNVLILEPQPISVLAQQQDVSCNSACDGSIDLLVSGGTGNITYTWDPQPTNGQGTGSVSGLCAGDWTVTITDAAGCDTSITLTITEPQPLTLTTSSTQSTCGVCSGTAAVVPAGGTAPFVFEWLSNGSIYGTDSILLDACAGLYQVHVVDANGCTAQQTVPVIDSDGEVVTTTSDIVTCPGACDGAVEAQFNCSIPSCTVAWFDVQGNDLGNAGSTLDSLCSGLYFVQVTNGNACITIDTALVIDPLPIVPNLSTTAETCVGACDGTATVGPTGGVAPYTFDWAPDPSNGDSTSIATGLCAGNYAVTITDSVGCSVLVDVLILSPQPLTVTSVVTPITCNGACDGIITVDAQGGTGQLSYIWTPDPPVGQATNTASQLCPDDWSLQVIDVNGCDTVLNWTITDPPVLLVAVTTTDNACYGDCAGEAYASIEGGTPGYTIIWSAVGGGVIGQGDTAITALCAGDYQLQVTDSSGCTSIVPFTIGEAPPLTPLITFTGETCNGPCDGVAAIQPGGGSGGYSFAWTDPNGQPFGTDTSAVSGLCAGNWSVIITDSLGCDSTISFTLLPYTPIAPGAQSTPILCNGACNAVITLSPSGGIGSFTYAWSPVPPNGDGTNTGTGLCPGDWSVTISDGVQCDTTITITITEPPAITIAVDQVTEASCNTAADGSISVSIGGGTPGLDQQWNGPNSFSSTDEDISGLVPGDYVITVTDANDCAVQQTVVVGALSTVFADAGPDLSQCFGPIVTLNGAGSQGAFTFAWTDEQGNSLGAQPLLDLGALAPGAYMYILTVADGPCTDDDTVYVNILELPLADAGPDQSIFLESVLTLGGQPSGPPGSDFLWSPDSLVSSATASNPTTSPGTTTWFTLSVTSPAGCTSLDSVLITVIPEIVIPSGFTPNGDGSNDAWQIDFIDQFPDCTVEVYNRWGELLFSSVGYREQWDGTYSGGLVPVGTYYYAIELNDERFPEPYTGPLTVIR